MLDHKLLFAIALPLAGLLSAAPAARGRTASAEGRRSLFDHGK